MRIAALHVIVAASVASAVGSGCIISAPEEQVERVDTDVTVYTGEGSLHCKDGGHVCVDSGALCDEYGVSCDFYGVPGVCSACCDGEKEALRCHKR